MNNVTLAKANELTKQIKKLQLQLDVLNNAKSSIQNNMFNLIIDFFEYDNIAITAIVDISNETRTKIGTIMYDELREKQEKLQKELEEL